ncbi:MAG: GAF domain-containing protein, partial [Chloroflexota bacterium]
MPTRILVVDDQPAELTPVLNWFNQEGYEVTVIENGDEALMAAEQTQPDLMLIDSAMPGLSGVETCQRLRRNANTAQIPLVLVTNLAPNEARAACFQSGANEFISRPIKLLELRDRINFILNPATVALGENTRLLEETCQAALTVLPCNVAWLLTIDDTMLNSRMIATDRGRTPNSAGEVFLRLVSGGAVGNPAFPLIAGDNPLAEVVLNASPLVNIALQEIQSATGGGPLFRALSGLRLSYAHFLPLSARGQITGMLVLASKEAHDISTVHGQRLITTLVNQASTVVENARLVSDLAARQEQMRIEQSFRKMVLDTMGDGLVVIDTEATITYANNRLLRMTGYTRSQLYGQSVGIIFHLTGRDALVTSLKRQTRSTLSFFQQLATKSGQVLPVLMSRASRVPTESSESSTVLVLSDISEQKRREQELEWQSERLRALNRAAQGITSALTVSDAITLMLEATIEIVQATSACLFLRDESQPDVYSVVSATGPQAAMLNLLWVHSGEGIAGRVVRDHHSALVPVVETEARQIERVGNSVIAVPLLLMDLVIGVLEGVNKTEGQFTQDDLEILENLAASGSVAIENARLFGQMQRRMNELNTLLEASAAVSSTLEIDRVLELVSRRLVEALNVVRCQVSRWNQTGNKLDVMAEVCNAYWEPDKGPLRPEPLTTLLGDIVRSGQPVRYRREAPDQDKRMQEHLLEIGMDNALLVPLRYDQTIIGLVELYSTNEQAPFTEKTIASVEKAIVHWRKQVKKEYADNWQDRDSLTTLYGEISHAADAAWCIVASCEGQIIRSLREIGFVLYNDELGVSYPLDHYMAMTYSLKQGAPVTLHPDTPEGDAVERVLMAQSGTSTGLIVPLLVRGEAV